MLVNLPPAVGHMSGQLTEFVELMAAKLMVNAHKDKIADKDIPVLLQRMADEVREFQEEVSFVAAGDCTEVSGNALEELADISNFAFLLYQHLRSRGVKNAVERFIDEFYIVDAPHGRVYCRKTRSGSPLKPGDEVKGSTRNGRVYIRAQHAITGAALSVARADLVWRERHGRWPEGKLHHASSYDSFEMKPRGSEQLLTATADAVWNLVEDAPKSTAPYPFTSQYRPKGRENSPNFGRWVYQRRHAFKLVRCGYYKTQEEAATQGLKDWKFKTRA